MKADKKGIGTNNILNSNLRKKRNFILKAFLILLMLGAFLLAGCSGSSGSDDSTSDDTSDTGTSAETGAYEQDGGTVSLSGQAYDTTESDESAVYVYNGGTFTLSDSTITKSGDTSDTESSDFYGLNAAVLAEDSSTITLSGCTLSSDAEGANGAFAYGEGADIILENCTITTKQNSSRGVDATYGGSVTLTDTTISTQGDHCAALATDRGEGSITAVNCTGTTEGEGSPGIYSTGSFVITGGSYTANGSEAAAIEGLNSITLTNTDLSGAVKRGVMIYQSMSGDSSVGTGTFRMTGGSLTNKSSGPVFFVCNTTGVISLNSVDISSSGTTFLKAAAPNADDPDTNTDWGSDGGTVTFTATSQVIEGDIICDESSSVSFTLSGTSSLSGAVDTDDEGNVFLTLDAGSLWTATGNSWVSQLSGVVLSGSTPINVNAASGITIYYSAMTDSDGNSLSGTYTLSGGGTLASLSGDTQDTDDDTQDTDDDDDTGDDSSGSAQILLKSSSVSVSGTGASVSGTAVTITSAGTYNISGTLTDGQIIVDTEDEETVTLIFDGVDIRNSATSPVYIVSAEATVIMLAANTENYITDGDTYVFEDPEEDEPDAAIFSKDDLTISGSGSLTVDANYNDGIKSKDGLIITGGTITVTSVDDGIMGKDYIRIEDGNITVDAQGDGLKSTNDDDTEKGYISIIDGVLNITAGADAIQAETSVTIFGGEFTLSSGGGSSYTVTDADSSAKGIKAGASITVNSGIFSISSADDALHSNGSLAINGGIFSVSSGDDGMHADASLEISGGTISISKAYEGIEGAVITINAGDIYIVASDDGLNVAGGNDGSSVNGRPGENPFSDSGNYYLYINGGYVVIDSGGDGLDSNGSIKMTGGVVLVNGPTDSANGAIDYQGSFGISGGFLVAAGSSGMAEAPDTSSAQYSLLINLNSSQSAGTMIHIRTSSGTEVLSFAPSKTYQSVVFSSPDLTSGSSYEVYLGGSSTGTNTDGLYEGGTYTAGTSYASFTVSSIVTSVGNGGTTPGGGGTTPGGMR